MSQPHEQGLRLREPPLPPSEPVVCPACGRRCDPVLFQFHPRIEESIARLIQAQHPHWARVQGACPLCVYEAVQHGLNQRLTTSLQHELQLPFPVYARAHARILPTPLRMHANPNYTGRGVTIAFLDSGFYPHPDLTRPRNRILRYVDATGSEPLEKDHFKKKHVSNWHGLMTSCVAAGNGFMSDYVYPGIASRANVVLVKTGAGRSGRIGERAIYRALSWVIANAYRYDIRVVNISLGGDRPSTGQLSELDELVEEAVARGMVVVVASGNGGHERVVPPASAPAAITVGGLDDQNSLDPHQRRMYHSSYGRGVNETRKPELIAPAIWLAAPMLPNTATHHEGMFLWRLIHASDHEFERALETRFAQAFFKQRTMRLPPDEIRRMIRGRMSEQKFIHAHYQHVDGTSFAAPIVSSIVAQMLEAHAALSPAQVKDILIATADPIAHVSAERQGHGVVNAARAIAAVLRAPNGPLAGLPLSPQVRPSAITFTYHDERAHAVALVGSFNDWQSHGHSVPQAPDASSAMSCAAALRSAPRVAGAQDEYRAYALHERSRGVWQITIPPLPHGVYAYKFVINHSSWINDPENADVMEDGYGGFHSLLKC